MCMKENSENNSNLDRGKMLNRSVKNFDYGKCLKEIYEDVLNNYAQIIRKKCDNYEKYGITDEILNKDLNSFLTQDDNGIILINGVNYKVDKTLFKIIDIATHEKILEYENAIIGKSYDDLSYAYKVAFYKNLTNARRNDDGHKPVMIRFDKYKLNYDYLTKENYFISLVKTTVLEEYILTTQHSNIYKSYNNILKKSVGQSI